MIRSFTLLSALVLVTGIASARADDTEMSSGLRAAMISTIHPLYLINWKVGDDTTYDVSLAGGFMKGTMHKFVEKDDNNGAAVWIEEDLAISGQTEKVEMELDRNTGNVLALLENGQAQQIPTDKPQIISEDDATITVPAGTFKTEHVKATESGKAIEFWANPVATPMDGSIKEIAATGVAGDMTMELTSFKKAQ